MHCSNLNEKANCDTSFVRASSFRWELKSPAVICTAWSYSHSHWVITSPKEPEMNVRVSDDKCCITVHVSLLSSECIKGTREWVNSLLLHVDGVWSRNQRLLKVTVPRRFNPSRSLSGRTLEHSRLCSYKLVMLNAGWQITQESTAAGWVCVTCASTCFFDLCMMWFMAKLSPHY